MLHNKILCKDFEHVLISNDVIIKSYDIFKISEMIKSSTPGHLKSIFKWPVQKEILSQSSCAFSNRACDWPRAVLGKIGICQLPRGLHILPHKVNMLVRFAINSIERFLNLGCPPVTEIKIYKPSLIIFMKTYSSNNCKASKKNKITKK